MTDTPQAAPSGAGMSGKVFLYDQPELLTPEEHGTLGLTPSDRPFDFVATVRVIPLTMTEFSSAQRNYPIVFASLDQPVPLAVVGLLEDVNLFVTDGQWDQQAYLPSYLRCYPFGFAAGDEGRVAVVIDRAAKVVTENPTYPFFADGKLTKETESVMRFCAQYEGERKRTQEFAGKLKELGLLVNQQATYTPEGATEEQTLASFVSIDAKKLSELDAEAVHAMHKVGQLSAAYLQLYSLENWRALLARRFKRQKAS